MVILSLPVELMDKICGDIQKTKVQYLQVVREKIKQFTPSQKKQSYLLMDIIYYLILVDSTGE